MPDNFHDDPMPEFKDMPFQNIEELPIEHPGAQDHDYRVRRDYIAGLSREFRLDPEHKIIDVEYTPEEQKIWQIVSSRLEKLHEKHASSFYLAAKKNLGITNDRIPQLSEMSRCLQETTGFSLAPIEGLVDTREFLSRLSWRKMLSTQYIRHHSQPEYTPEPDIVHEAIGHIPMFTNKDFADFSQFIGHGARMATDEQIEELGRLYWYTVEFGLVEEAGKTKAYGAGLLSGYGELERAFTDEIERRPFDLQEVINMPFDYWHMQPVYYVIPSYEYLKEATREYIESIKTEK
jgi:phenylalanine-4-hydroxylase